MTQEIVEDGQIWNAIDRGGGQMCDIPGVVRALSAVGYVIVPWLPTREMLDAANAAGSDLSPALPHEVWPAMIDAAIGKGQ